MVARRFARGFALVALIGLARAPIAAAKDDPAAGKPAGKALGELRMTVQTLLDGQREVAAKAKDAVAAQVIDEVRALLAGEGPTGASPAVVEESEPKPWLEASWRRIEPQATKLAESADPAFAAVGGLVRQVPDVVRALRHLNRRRVPCGLKAFRFHAARSLGCVLHARYLAAAGFVEISKRPSGFHGEDAKDPNATPQGLAAAGASIMAMYPLLETIDILLDTFIHRLPLLVPGEASIAMGTWTGAKEAASVLLNAGDAAKDGREIPDGVCYPAPGSDETSRQFWRKGELPPPVLGVDLGSLGCPVTVSFYGRGTPRAVEAKLVSARGEVIACHVVTPEAPLNPGAAWPIHVAQSIALIPKAPLDSSTTFTATVKCRLGETPWEKTWRFTTR